MSDLAAKVWVAAYPDRRPWAQLEPDTQAEWTRVVEVVVQLAGARELLADLHRLSHWRFPMYCEDCGVSAEGDSVIGRYEDREVLS